MRRVEAGLSGRSMRKRRRRPVPGVTAAAVGLGLAAGVSLPVIGLLDPGWRSPPGPGWLLGPDPIPAPAWDAAAEAPLWSATALQAAELNESLALLFVLALLVLGTGVAHACLVSLSRTAADREELALRSALGARRWQLRALLVARGARVGLIGLSLGVALSLGFRLWLDSSLPEALGRPGPGTAAAATGGFPQSPGTLLTTGALVLLVVALTPVLLNLSRRMWRSPALGLRPGSGPSGGGRGTHTGAGGLLGWTLAVGQVALSLSVTGAAVTLLRTAPEPSESARLPAQAADTVVLRVELSGTAAPSGRAALLTEIEARARTAAGAGLVAYGSPGALLGVGTGFATAARCPWCYVGGLPVPVTFGPANYHAVGGDFFRIFGVTPPDDAWGSDGGPLATSPGAVDREPVVVDRAFVRDFFQDEDPEGRELWPFGAEALRAEGSWVAGVVDLERPAVLGTGGGDGPTVYVSAARHPPPVIELAARPPRIGPPLSADRLRRAVEEAGPGVRATTLGTLDDVFRRGREPVPWLGRLAAALALAAVIVSGAGLLVGLSDRLRMRQSEVGLRRAVGARRRDVLRLGLEDALRVLGAGVAVGLICWAGFGDWIALLHPGAHPLEPATLLGMAAALVVAGGGTALRASWRLARLDPVTALSGAGGGER